MLDNTGSVFKDRLAPREQLLWTGSPRQGLVLRDPDGLAIIASLLPGAAACYLGLSWLQSGASLLTTMAGYGLILAAIYAVLGRFVINALRRQGSRYALTDKRIMIFAPLFGQEVSEFELASFTDVRLYSDGHGRGTVAFEAREAANLQGLNLQVGKAERPRLGPSFEMIENAEGVFDMIRRLRDGGLDHPEAGILKQKAQERLEPPGAEFGSKQRTRRVPKRKG